MANFSAGLILCFILITFAAVPSRATDYTVGDAAGWTLGADYTSWTAGKTFVVGDNLVFKYASSHTVDEVTSSDYSACSSANSISSDSSGSTTIPLKTPGTHYFICGAIGHCSGGMKLSVAVAAGGAGGSATTPPTGNGGSTTSPATPTTGTPATPATRTPGTTSTLPSSSGTVSPFTALLFTLGAVVVKLVLS